jgi:cytochrome c oxidase subunit 2
VRRGSIVQLVLLGVLIAAAVTVVALLIPWLPPSASRERGRIDFVFWFTTGICIFIFALVASVIVYAVVTFRARPGDDRDGAPIHGHTGLEVVWTAVPAVLVTAISIVSGIVLVKNGEAGPRPLRIKVTAQQFAWRFEYRSGVAEGVNVGRLTLPLHRRVELDITSRDVIHSFWVPEFGQKQDAVPGRDNKLVITPTKLGEFPVVCTELCGLGHSIMRSTVRVLSPKDFADWAREQRSGAGGGDPGLAAFAQYGCGGCHTLAAVGSNATIGPDLDKIADQARQAGQPLEQFIRESIVNPDAYIDPGFEKGVMPTNFGESIPAAQVDALVALLAKGAGK